MVEWREDVEIWRQISAEIRKRIQSGEYGPGKRLTQNTLAQEFGVAPNTVRKALKDLRERGLIYTRLRLGSFVGPEPEEEGN
ncbi:winged helix-turn-helix domain-containing protein [Nonomuraea sp. NPDC049486]|uniref:GntR family transcriptional regulator n=1 Tax=Nonomuraea sp. NPDC049486 TaxID=3155773 RepID=UPI0034302BAA